MPTINDWDITLETDQVIRAQGADPAAIRHRSPKLVEVAESAIADGTPLLNPKVLFRRMTIEGFVHERIKLEGGGELRGPLLAQHLAPATEVLLILCTIGDELETLVSEVIQTDPVFGLALDGVGSAAVEVLANAACNRFELETEERQLETSIPLSPGMVDWSVEQGQPQIFEILPAEEIGISLTPSLIMLPRKSLSMVIGIGTQIAYEGTTCDFCSMRDTCRYQDHYA